MRPWHKRWTGVNRLRRLNITRGCAKCRQSPTQLAWCPHRYGLRPSRPSGSHNQRYVLRPNPATAAPASRTLLNSLISALALTRQCVGLVRRYAQSGVWSPRPPSVSACGGSQLRCSGFYILRLGSLASHPPPRGLPENPGAKHARRRDWLLGASPQKLCSSHPPELHADLKQQEARNQKEKGRAHARRAQIPL